jgi:hypothetical protein
MPRARSAPSKTLSADAHVASAAAVSVFFVNTQDGRVATRRQLAAAGLVDAEAVPVSPWHPIQGPSDASTMWYAVLRKRERGVFIGTLCIRHTGRQALLEASGWEEVPVERIRVEARPRPGPAQPM